MTCKDCLSYDVCMKWTDYWLDADRARDCEYCKNINQIKAEAIKEFWRSLKEQAYIPNLSLTGEYVIDVSDGENIVKEMVGE